MKFQTLVIFSGYRMLALLLGKLLHRNRGLFLLFPVVLMGMFLGWSSIAYAGPANPEPTQITQPDGTTFQSIMRGDEFQGWMETADGYTIVKNPTTGFFEYASHDAEGNLVPSGILITAPNAADLSTQGLLPPKGLRPPPNTDLQLYKDDFLEAVRAQRTASGLSATPGQTGVWAPIPVSGPKKILVILVNFWDASLSSGAAAYWSNVVHNNTGANSVFKYYQDNSFSHISISPVAHTQPGSPTGVVTVSLARNHPNYGNNYDYPTESAWINSALVAAAPYVGFAALDTNGDGTISVDEALIYFVLAGYETSAGSGLTPSIWAHAWGGPGVTVGGKSVNHWALNGEKYNNSYLMKMGVIAHEMGHAMGGLPDLYDIAGVNQGLGIFTLMAGGSWGRKSGEIGGATAVGLDAWSRQYLGWSTPQSAVNGATFSFVSGLSSPNSALMLMNSTSSTSEYWLVENRPPVGWDAGMNQYLGTWTGGLLIQHIDLNVGTKSANSFNKYVSGAHQGNMAEEPSTALCSLQSGATKKGCPTILYYSGNSTAFNPASTPSSRYYSGVPSGLGVSGISPPGTTMSATVSATSGGGSTVMTPISLTNLSGATGSAQLFQVAVPAGASNLVIQTSGGTGDVDLYVRASDLPTFSVYDCRSWDSGNNETCTFPTPLATTYYIVLYGYDAYSGVSLTASFTVASAGALTGASEIAIHVYRALSGQAPSKSQFDSYTGQIGASNGFAWANQMAGVFSNVSDYNFATGVMTNLGLQGFPALHDPLMWYLGAVGIANRGAVVIQFSEILSNLVGDVTFGPAAAAFNAQCLIDYNTVL